MVSCKRFSFRCVRIFLSLPSTQGTAKKLRKPFSAVAAQRQTKGKGRFEREWNSSWGGLYVTLTVKEPLGEKFSLLPIVAAAAAREAIHSASGVDCSYKWPNDLMWKRKKVSGILVETIIQGNMIWAFIGIGINVSNKIPFHLKSKAASLQSICGKKIETERVLDGLLSSFSSFYGKYRDGNTDALLNSYRKGCMTLGTKVVVRSGTRVVRGIAKAITDEGFLVVSSKRKDVVIVEGTLRS